MRDSLDEVYVLQHNVAMRGNQRGAWRNSQYQTRQQNPYRNNHMRPPGLRMPLNEPGPPRQQLDFEPHPMDHSRNFPHSNHNFMPDLPPPNIQPYRPEMRQNFPQQPQFKQYPYEFIPPFESAGDLPPNIMGQLPPRSSNRNSPIRGIPGMNKSTDGRQDYIDSTRQPPVINQDSRNLPLPPNLPPQLTGKKVLINPHFKGNLQTSLEGVATYIPTRIEKPPLSPTLESKFGPIRSLDDAAERFIAEQRSALARAASRPARRSPPRRSPPRRSPLRYSAKGESEPEVSDYGRFNEAELLRRQEEFINANRAGLRRRMRSPTPPRRSPSPRRAQPARYQSPHVAETEESEYKRKVREQENLRDRVMRAKEARRRKNAAAVAVAVAQKQTNDKESEVTGVSGRDANHAQKTTDDKETKGTTKPKELTPEKSPVISAEVKLTEKEKKVPEPPKAIEVRKIDNPTNKSDDSLNTQDASRVTEPVQKTQEIMPKSFEAPKKRLPSPPKRVIEKKRRSDELDRMTPPLPIPQDLKKETSKPEKKVVEAARVESSKPEASKQERTPESKRVLLEEDDDMDALDLILNDIDDILSDSEESDRPKERSKDQKSPVKTIDKTTAKNKSSFDLRSKLPLSNKSNDSKQKQKIVFSEAINEKKKTDASQPKRRAVTPPKPPRPLPAKEKPSDPLPTKERIVKALEPSRDNWRKDKMKIVFDHKEEPVKEKPKVSFPMRRVILKRSDDSKTQKSVFSRIASRAEPKANPSQPSIGIFSRAMRTALGTTAIDKRKDEVAPEPEKGKQTEKPKLDRLDSHEPNIEVDTDTDDESLDEDLLLRDDDESETAGTANSRTAHAGQSVMRVQHTK